jgi:hypothetical protein
LGLAIDSFGCKNYYVSFIGDFSKFTWIYLLHRKSKVFKYFHEFQQLVEHMFHHKIMVVQSDWGRWGMRSFILSFGPLALIILYRVHMPTNKMVLLIASIAI